MSVLDFLIRFSTFILLFDDIYVVSTPLSPPPPPHHTHLTSM